MRITKLNKIFHKYPFGIKSSGDVHAFKDIYLEVDDCELLALLGHNGAGNLNYSPLNLNYYLGKTTLIGALTGTLESTSGRAEICNYNINDDMDEVNKFNC